MFFSLYLCFYQRGFVESYIPRRAAGSELRRSESQSQSKMPSLGERNQGHYECSLNDFHSSLSISSSRSTLHNLRRSSKALSLCWKLNPVSSVSLLPLSSRLCFLSILFSLCLLSKFFLILNLSFNVQVYFYPSFILILSRRFFELARSFWRARSSSALRRDPSVKFVPSSFSRFDLFCDLVLCW